ncbi:MAG TPA: ectonucleotide pyrophosphatase/phosphodiesterase, partial [Puia sp.]|nr:ectonucleotide pyrophosphatase/phosphodiesterase [Puia sp.]
MFCKTKISFLLIFFIAQIAIAQDTTQQIVAGRTNSADQQKKPYVILISADGFRYDLADKYNAVNLIRLRSEGINAAYMQASYPSLTFPNHYTIVTGLYPAHHGIVDNTFYDKQKNETYTIRNKKAVGDGTWYGGTPLWVLAEKQQMLSASFYWVASESAIQGVRPTYYYIYNDAIPIDKRIETVKNWLQLPEDKRPHFITFYFPQVDHQEHTYGPDSKEAEDAVHLVDESVGKLVRTVDSLGLDVSFIFVADHGMLKVDNEHTLPLPHAVDTTKFLVLPGTALLHLYAKKKKDILPTYRALKLEAKDYDVYLATKMPVKWHYSKKDDRFNRTGDIILVPHPPKVFNIGKGHIPLGEHGFDPAIPEMRATFYAWGPAFQ